MNNIINKIKSVKMVAGIILSVITLQVSFTSCEDMMTVQTGDKAYVNGNDTLYSYLGIMRAMQDIAERQIILGEIRGDLVSSTEWATDTLYAISNFDDPKDQSCSMLQVSDYYKVINNCNFYIYNCDTSAVKANVKYMVREYAQVKAIRAWAYLQLVKNYRQVPYITEPVKNLDIIKNFDYNNNLVDKDNLIDKLLEDGLDQFCETLYPQYAGAGNSYVMWNNGANDISAKILFVPIRLVIADSYLLRGQTKSDYENAARYYYDYLKNEDVVMSLEFCDAAKSSSGEISYSSSSWGLWADTYDDKDSELITTIPSSANAGLGKMLTRVADIFGFTPTSHQTNNEQTKVNEDTGEAEGTGEYRKGGSISVTPTYKRQYAPSNAYIDVNNDQTFVFYKKLTNETVMDSIPFCDARYGASTGEYRKDGESYLMCAKAARSSRFYYCIPIYRKTIVWLRLAEAINRAGYPEFAFAILKDGLNYRSIPRVRDGYRYKELMTTINGKEYAIAVDEIRKDTLYVDTVTNGQGILRLEADGQLVQASEFTNLEDYQILTEAIPTRILTHASSGAMYYINDTLKIQEFNRFLDFSDDIWTCTFGIHARGAGLFAENEFTTRNPITAITGLNDPKFFTYDRLIRNQGVDPTTADEADIINAVENIIVDELALESAFEGNRFTDLVRIAEHKNASGKKGTEWLANKIANRGSKKATDKTPAVTDRDESIYNKLLNQNRWYFSLPAWNVK